MNVVMTPAGNGPMRTLFATAVTRGRLALLGAGGVCCFCWWICASTSVKQGDILWEVVCRAWMACDSRVQLVESVPVFCT